MTDAPIPLVDLSAAHAEIADAVSAGLARVIASNAFVLGPDVAAFEEEFARFTETRFGVGVSNGTDALELALRALGVGAGDEVLLPANTFFATAVAVVRAGATPALVDCDPEHLLMDPAETEGRVGARTRALLPVHLYGQMAPMEPLLELASRHGLFVVEDFAQAQGARQHGAPAGSLGAAGATSFYPGKNLGAYGDAGALVTDDAELAAALRALRNYGGVHKNEHAEVGFNCRLDTLQATVLRTKLARLDDWNGRRRRAAARYDELLAPLAGIAPIPTRIGNEHVHHLYVVRVLAGEERRDRVLAHLGAEGIGAAVHYPAPVHATRAFRGLGHSPGDFPVAEQASREVLSLPLHPHLSAEQQARVVACLEHALSR